MNDLISILILLVLSGFFSGSETALTSLSKARAESLVKEGRHGANALWRLKSNTTRMLIMLLIGNNLVNIAASALATVIATQWFGHIGPGIAVGVLTILILIFGEVTPKSWAAHNSERISLFAAPLILAFGRLVLPLVWVLERFTLWLHKATKMRSDPTVTESELISMVEHGAEEGTIERDEREMIKRVFAFHDLLTEDVMTSRHEVFSLDGNLTIREALPQLLAERYSRIPLYEQDPDDVQKVLHLRDVLEAVAEDHLDTPLHSISRDAVFVPENQPIDELFATLHLQKQHLALVVDEYGVLQGVVTLENLLEELVGEIYDESDKPPERLRELKPGQIAVDGNTELRIVQDYFHRENLSEKPTDTVSLWILNHAARIPKSGEEFTIAGLTVYVEKASQRRIQQVRIARAEEPDSSGENGDSEEIQKPTSNENH